MGSVVLDNSDPARWNTLSSPWLEALDSRGVNIRISPLEALANSADLCQLAFSNPLDLFAAHRFLLSLLYWKAGAANGTRALRERLVSGTMPQGVIESIREEASAFNLFDPERPFLQDPACRDDKKESPPSYLFAEMASGTNVAHFHHGEDDSSRLCLCCATRGLLRLAPWMQSGGKGLKPAIHGAPPIMAIAMGDTLRHTLGLNLIPFDGHLGNPQWTGPFKPTREGAVTPLLEAFTWNTRRVHLLDPSPLDCCSNCGSESGFGVGPIVFKANEACKDDSDEGQAYADNWRDPAAFYTVKDGDTVNKTVKSTDESQASVAADLTRLIPQKRGKAEVPAPRCLLTQANPGHANWILVIPCTNPANNKTFDHRLVAIRGELPGAIVPGRNDVDAIPVLAGDPRTLRKPWSANPSRGARVFVNAASRLQKGDWAVLAGSAGKPLGHDAAAFDIFSSLYWPIRSRVSSAPSREAAWMTLKLMAVSNLGGNAAMGDIRPWNHLKNSMRKQKSRNGINIAYPRRIPKGVHLETELGGIIRRFSGKGLDWAGLCQFLNDHLS